MHLCVCLCIHVCVPSKTVTIHAYQASTYEIAINFVSIGQCIITQDDMTIMWLSCDSTKLQLRTKQDEERKRLMAARDRIRNDMGIMVGKSHGPAQVDPNQCTDMIEKTGYLGKRPDNALRLPRRQWPKKYCTVSMQGFTLANSHVSQCTERVQAY